MVHGILQFTPSIAFRYVLHRCKSRDIRCRESFSYTKDVQANATRRRVGICMHKLIPLSLARFAPGFVVRQAEEHVARKLQARLLARGKKKERHWAKPMHSPFLMNKFTSFLDVKF